MAWERQEVPAAFDYVVVFRRAMEDHALEVVHAYLQESMSDYELDATPATSEGENFSSHVYRVRVSNDRTRHLIVKVAPEARALRQVFPLRAMYEQEAFYYRRVFAELPAFVAHPRLYCANLEDHKEVFVFEDLTALGYVVHKPTDTLNYEHCVLVLKAYAKLHAASYALKRHKPEVFGRLMDDARDHVFQGMTMSEVRERQLRERTAVALDALHPVQHAETRARFLEFSKTMFTRVQIALRADTAGEHAVFTHSDGWICNYMFRYEEEEPKEVCVLDWQLAHGGSPALDLSFFFFSCTDRSLRQQHYNDLLRVYHDELARLLRDADCDVDETFSYEVLLEHMRKFSAYGIYMAVVVLNVSLLRGGKAPSLKTAKDEADVLRFRTGKTELDRRVFDERVGGAILDFVDYGFC